MSPQLHATLYGFQQHDWMQTLRLGATGRWSSRTTA